MTEDENEANSLRYGAKAFYILALSSGKFAILFPDRSLFKIVNTIEETLAEGPKAQARYFDKQLYFSGKASILPFDNLELDL